MQSVETGEARRIPYAQSDWLEIAAKVLAAEGVEAVQITRLARELGVTRGSFYWHFRDRGDLLDALIEDWRQLNSGLMGKVLDSAATLTDGVLSLFALWGDAEPFNARLDQAMRDWARRSQAVRDVVSREEDGRVDAIRAFFRKHGFTESDAFVRARVIYFTQVSYYALGIEEPISKRLGYLEEYYRCFTGIEIDAGAAEAFRQRWLKRRKSR